MKYLLLTIASVVLTMLAIAQQTPKVIVGIFAHPDDENMVGDVLANYASKGAKVYVIIATDGKDGTRVTSIPAGDSLGKIRQQESICACKALGIQPPIFLSLDRIDTKIGVRAYLNNHKRLLEQLKHYLLKLKPDVLITFGPDGEYGHSEHIVAGAAITELLLKEGWVENYPLYFLAWKKEQVTDDEDLGFVDSKYLDIEIGYTSEDERKSLEAAKCYKTQFTDQEVQELVEQKTKDAENKVSFRKFTVSNKGSLRTGF